MVTKFSEGQDKQYTFIEKGRIKCTWGDRANTTHDTMESTLLQKEKRRTEAANKMNPELYFYFSTLLSNIVPFYSELTISSATK